MTLGGLALAVGILVDDATVTIENINWHLEQGKDVRTAILDGAQQIVTPAFVSLLCICIVFVPMFALQGVAGLSVRADGRGGGLRHDRLLHPVAHAGADDGDVSAAAARTADEPPDDGTDARRPRYLAPLPARLRSALRAVREGYRNLLALALAHRREFRHRLPGCRRSRRSCWCRSWARTSFPSVDSGQITLHVRAPVGTRIEDTAAMFDHIEQRHPQTSFRRDELDVDRRQHRPAGQRHQPVYNNSGLIGYQDGDIYHQPEAQTIIRPPIMCASLRERLPRDFPGRHLLLPAGRHHQPDPELRRAGAASTCRSPGRDQNANQAYAPSCCAGCATIPGIADARMQQSTDNPQLRRRRRPLPHGATRPHRARRDQQRRRPRSPAASRPRRPSGSIPRTASPIRSSRRRRNTTSTRCPALENIPVTGGDSRAAGAGRPRHDLAREQSDAVVTHYNIQPAFDIYATTQDRDLGGVAERYPEARSQRHRKDLPRGAPSPCAARSRP